MAHLVTDVQNSKGDLVLKGIPAWHGLGTVFEEGKVITIQDALKYGGLDFEVAKAPLQYHIPNCEEPIIIEDSFFTYRTDINKVLGKAVGGSYGIVQPKEILKVMDSVLEHGYSIESVGALDHGRLIFATSKLDTLNIKNGSKDSDDLVNQYLIFSTTYDGSASTKAYFSNVRVVCNNTLQFSLKEANNMISIRNTHTATERLQEASVILRNAALAGEKSVSAYTKMKQSKVTRDDLVNYVANCLLDSKDLALAKKKDKKGISTRKLNIINSVMDFSINGIGQKEIYGSAWGAYNAVTGYFSNIKSHQKQETRFSSLLHGDDAKTMQKAFSMAEDFETVQTIDLDWLNSTAIHSN
jgi:phage/plasmid-like protein (TIGR03299 family)